MKSNSMIHDLQFEYLTILYFCQVIMDGKVKVQSIEWLSTEAKEALVTISDGNHMCLAYHQPCHLGIGDLVSEPLLAMSALGAVIDNENEIGFLKMYEPFDYNITAEVVDVEAEIVKVGSILIDIEPSLPGDTTENDRVNFNCTRLDIMDYLDPSSLLKLWKE